MIVCREIEGRAVYIPVIYDADRDVYVPVSGGSEGPLEAARAGLEHLIRQLEPIWQSAQKLRALCEHPEHAGFRADGISGALVADEARQLTKLMEFAWINIVGLLDELGPEAAASVLEGGEEGDAKVNISDVQVALRELEEAFASMHRAIGNAMERTRVVIAQVGILEKEDAPME